MDELVRARAEACTETRTKGRGKRRWAGEEISIGATRTLFVVALATGSLACRPPAAEEQQGAAESIVDGASARAYTDAALVDGVGFVCSGAVIAPRVVLTAGHCAHGGSWTVQAPYAEKQSAHASRAWTRYVATGMTVNPNSVDVAVLILDTPITLASYPTLASAAVPFGTRAVNVGRIHDGSLASGLFVGAPVALSSGASSGFPFAYVATDVIESGDSGGPVYVGGGAARTLVAVNSGGGGGRGGEILARVDLAYTMIQEIIAANGTGETSGTEAPALPPQQGCTAESEPNDTSSLANALAGTACGSLSSGSDVDWYRWTVASEGVTYDLVLSALGDADMFMWKDQGAGWVAIPNATPTHIAATSTAAGNYVIAVRSPSAAPQTYSLEITQSVK